MNSIVVNPDAMHLDAMDPGAMDPDAMDPDAINRVSTGIYVNLIFKPLNF